MLEQILQISFKISFGAWAFQTTWWSGYCYWKKRECNLNQSRHDSFVEWVAKNNGWNNGDRHKIHEIFLINCFVFVITLVWKAIHRSAMIQIKAHLMEKNIAPNCSQVIVPILAGWTKKLFGYYAISKLFSSGHQGRFQDCRTVEDLGEPWRSSRFELECSGLRYYSKCGMWGGKQKMCLLQV